ncbi:MAG: T9SS type A sorting domain-containing protein, partial [Bacteroidetes bacterium]|nr:T9SS type A sorting domain-containing protein [Bacteroidota bacterium]
GNGDINIFIIRNNWSYYSGTTFGANGYDYGYSIEPTIGNGFVICGYTNSFNNLLEDIYLIKTDSTGFCSSLENTFITDIESSGTQQNSEFNIFPNPAATTLTFSSGKLFDSAVIQIFDIIGNSIKSIKVDQNQKEPISINISDLADGIYILNLTTSKSSYSQKLIIQH